MPGLHYAPRVFCLNLPTKNFQHLLAKGEKIFERAYTVPQIAPAPNRKISSTKWQSN